MIKITEEKKEKIQTIDKIIRRIKFFPNPKGRIKK